MTVLDRALVRLLPAVPRPVVKRISDRYIAGTELADACRVVRRLNEEGKAATVDVLGEAVTKPDQARAFVDAYHDVLDSIEREGLDSNISVKPTAFGLEFDYALLRENLEQVVAHAARCGNFVRVDMEDSSTTDDTLRAYRELRGAGFDNLGVVLQAALRRTVDDVHALAGLRPNVRLCKGIYVEPEEVAFQDFQEVRESFVRALEALFDAGCHVGIATHDEYLVDEGRRLVAERGLGHDRYEFQMLLGVRPDLGDELVRAGHRLRIYVPYGRDWYDYSLRRLQENPRIAGYIAADTVGRVVSVLRPRNSKHS